jgi:hypothetical protein
MCIEPAPAGTPNIRWSPRWVALILVGDPEGVPDARLHLLERTDEYGLAHALCGYRGRAVRLDGSYDRGHPVVGCRTCLYMMPLSTQRRYRL